MALRWCAAGMIEAGKQFRRVNGPRRLSWSFDDHTGARAAPAQRHRVGLRMGLPAEAVDNVPRQGRGSPRTRGRSAMSVIRS